MAAARAGSSHQSSENNMAMSPGRWQQAQRDELDAQQAAANRRAESDRELARNIEQAGFSGFADLNNFLAKLAQENDTVPREQDWDAQVKKHREQA